MDKYQEKYLQTKPEPVTPFEKIGKKYVANTVRKFCPPNSTLLDIGCDKGVLINILREYSCIGIDLNPNRFLFQQTYVVGAGENLPFSASKFDVITLCEVIEHIPCPEPLIEEIIRVLKEDGRLILSTTDRSFWIGGLLETIKEHKIVRYWFNRPIYNGKQHEKEYSPLEIHLLFEKEGFRLIDLHFIGSPFTRLFLSPLVYGRFSLPKLYPLITLACEMEYRISRKANTFLPKNLCRYLIGRFVMVFRKKEGGIVSW